MPKSNRSPLYFYAIEYRRQYQSIHGSYLSINEAIQACYDDWKALSNEEKQPYTTQYEQWRKEFRTDLQSNSNIHSLTERDIPCTELKRYYDRFTFDKNFLACEYLPLDINELLSMPIYIINFQIFCKVDEEDGGQFIPAEMCILRYKLFDGVTNYMHKFIKPTQIPEGYLSSCIEQSRDTHEIPLKNFPEATDNYRQIYDELKSFISATETTKIRAEESNERIRRRQLRSIQPCVFYPSLECEQTCKILDWLQEKAEGIAPTKTARLFNFASMESLIATLAQLKNDCISQDEISKAFGKVAYSYLIEQRCLYHSHLDICHCSIARCHAVAKLISNYLYERYFLDYRMDQSNTTQETSRLK